MKRPTSTYLKGILFSLSLMLSASNASAVGVDDEVGGYSLDNLAKAFASAGNIRGNYGEANEDAPFEQWLNDELGSTTYEYDSAYSKWKSEFENDESGELEARFFVLIQKHTIEFQFGDTSDKAQEVREGVTLENYAKIAVALTQQPNVELPSLLSEFGINSESQWEKVSAAWVKAMTEDSSIMTQYGLLYQKHAGPQFAAAQEAQLADQLSGHYDDEAEDAEDDDSSETGAKFYSQELTSPVSKDRWYAANRMLHECSRFRDFGDDEGIGLAEMCSDSALSTDVVPVIKELLTSYENDSIEEASGILYSVEEMGLEKEVTKQALLTAIERAKQQYNVIEAEYKPLQFKNLPGKEVLRSRLDSTSNSIEEFEESLSEWD